MKPLHIVLLLFAFFITGLADGIEAGLSTIGAAPAAIPIIGTLIAGATEPVGILLGLTVGWCINVTMGSGLILLLVINGLYHPKFAPAGLIGAFIPGIDTLPFFVGIVIAGIMYDAQREGGLIGTAAGMIQTATAAASGNIIGAAQGAKNALNAVSPTTAAANDNTEASQERTPSTLQNKNFDGITKPAPTHVANDNFRPYVQKAA